MQEFVDATPEFEHRLLRAGRDGEYIPAEISERFVAVEELPQGTLPRLRAVRDAVRRIRPDVVHAHSSYAGLYVRLAVPATRRRRIVYSPHCFAFVRQDLGLASRMLIAAAEILLACNTTVIAACSLWERRVARRMPSRGAVYVPNTPRAAATQGHSGGPAADGAAPGAPIAVSLGRLGPQKDPALFLRAVTEARRTIPGLRGMWIGDGDPALRTALTEGGVEVTGWLPSGEVAARLAEASVYLHAAAWEGFPLAVLEAARAGVPVVARRIPAFEGMPERWLFDGPADAGRLIGSTLTDGGEANVAEWRAALRTNTPEHQRAALLRAYGRERARR